MASTTLTSWALLIWNSLKEMGYDPGIPFRKAGLDASKLGDGQARYKAEMMFPLWEETVKLTDNPDIGVTVGQNWSPTTFHALGYAWLASSSLKEAFERLVRYADIVNNSLITEFQQDGSQYRFSLTTSENRELVHPVGSDAGIAAIITMCRMLLGPQFSPVAMELFRPYRSPGTLEAFVGVSASYDNDQNIILLDATQAEQRLKSANSTLVIANEKVILDYLGKLQKNDIVNAVSRVLMKELPSGACTEDFVADSLNIHKRTLQRKLRSEGYTFKQITNEIRKNLALNYINNSQLSLTEIAYLVGFADQSNFTRAFRRWAGTSPSTYRTTSEEKAAAGH